jgi:hypothetical protein
MSTSQRGRHTRGKSLERRRRRRPKRRWSTRLKRRR